MLLLDQVHKSLDQLWLVKMQNFDENQILTYSDWSAGGKMPDFDENHILTYFDWSAGGKMQNFDENTLKMIIFS